MGLVRDEGRHVNAGWTSCQVPQVRGRNRSLTRHCIRTRLSKLHHECRLRARARLKQEAPMLTIYGPKQRFCDGISRRNFLKIGALGLGGLTLPQLLQAEIGRASCRERV